jgi:signal transduction histidine kinase
MFIHVALMAAGSLLISLGAILGINGLHQDMGLAVQGYQELRQIYEVGFHVAAARDALDGDHPDPAKALAAINIAAAKLDESDYNGNFGAAAPDWLDESARTSCRARLRDAATLLQNPSNATPVLEIERSSLNDLLGQIAGISSGIRVKTVARQTAATHKRDMTLAFVIGLSAAVITVVIIVGIRQYRGVVAPLDRLGRGVRAFAAGRFASRIDTAGDREFALLAGDFNSMAHDLESLYLDLETKVRLKSRELVRSERLASVGFLAAGVAHEINNPLSIIAGYGERSLQMLGKGLDLSSLPRTQKAIQIMCDEAFRCKEITGRLLSLARPAPEDRRLVPLLTLARDVISNLRGLPKYANRPIRLESPGEAPGDSPGDSAGDEDFTVLANEGEMKQVILNLLINALEAVPETTGSVSISLRRVMDEIELSISDNGRGMSPETLDRAFEPFFTEKRGQRHGTGLGLSITHAIVRDHAGAITAESAGLGAGSRFIVRLPAISKGAEYAGS